MSDQTIRCPACGSTDESVVITAPRQVVGEDGRALEFLDLFTRCGRCGEEFYTREQSLASSRAAASALRAHEGLLSPDEIRAIRERLGWTQAQLEQALGVGPKTVVRWERGTVRQSRAADRLLRVLAAHPEHVLETQTTHVTTPGLLGTQAMATVLGGTVVFPPVAPGTTFYSMVLPPGFGMVTTTLWSGAVVVSQTADSPPAETSDELEGVLEAATEELSLAA